MMTTWARIENDMVMEVTDVDPAGRFHPSLTWVQCPDGTAYHDEYKNGVFTKHVTPVLPTPEEMQAALTGDLDPQTLAAAEAFIKLGD